MDSAACETAMDYYPAKAIKKAWYAMNEFYKSK